MVLATIVQRKEKLLYISLYYAAGAMVWTAINFPIGNILLPYKVPGVNNAALHGLYIHYIVGLWITPAGLALVYFFLPLAAKNPLYSHKLSLVGFWSIAFFYPFVGIHHYLYSPIPNWTQTIAIVTSMMLIVPVWTVTQNFFGTMMGNWKALQESFVAKFCIMGAVFYWFGCFQGSTEALRGMQQLTHFTDFVISHSHLTIFGTFVVWTMAGVYYVWPLLADRHQFQHHGGGADADGASAGNDVGRLGGIRGYGSGDEAVLDDSNTVWDRNGHRHLHVHGQHADDRGGTLTAGGSGP
jgi:cytochrome c oxidase cbb3-type subunit 1